MLDLEDIRAFVEVAEAGGFGRAGQRLKLSKSMVSRRVSRLEAELGAQLLSRTTRGVAVTEAGMEWYTADIQQRKVEFAGLAVAHAPLIHTICRTLENSEDGALRDDFFLDLLRRGMTDEAARRQLDIAIDWGRYAELFDYDADRGELVLTEVFASLHLDDMGSEEG